MPRIQSECIEYQVVELGGARYAIIRETILREVCRQAGTRALAPGENAVPPDDLAGMEGFDAGTLPGRLIARRKQAGLAQVQLARLAGVRVETLNRIERGKVTPDFATIRKLVTAIKAAEIGAHHQRAVVSESDKKE
jgi:DNA-binding XRE family transcriptional regulator